MPTPADDLAARGKGTQVAAAVGLGLAWVGVLTGVHYGSHAG
jgi:hypothetical protein